ncbi:MAG TPA: pre-peptidase C-terminal domain-containing protein [Phototrophicaceae bacterium]|nr:pre-peptidase C-terminal domain-containing protein [Phototrophicaceae bacterium]
MSRFFIPIFLLIFLIAAPAFATDYVAYAWTDANLALIYPQGWSDPVASVDSSASADALTLSGGSETIMLRVLPASTQDGAMRPALEALVATLDQLPLKYTLATLYGRSGLRIDTVSADRGQSGIARMGRLPDNRVLLIAGRTHAADSAALDSDISTILASMVFSAKLPPVQPSYVAGWSAPASDQIIYALAAHGDALYVLDSGDGVRVLDAATGAERTRYPFDHPAQPTGIAVDGQGVVYISDALCRCVRRMTPDGKWLDPVGSFGGGAPFSLAVTPDGTIYATDKNDSGYTLRILKGDHSRTINLSFNADAPPLVTVDSTGQAWVIEWLTSLIDGQVSGAVSFVDNSNASTGLQFWLNTLTPDTVTAVLNDLDGNLVVGTPNQGVLVVNGRGETISQFAQQSAPRALAFGADGTLYMALGDNSITSYALNIPTDRVGGAALALDVPVQGTLAQSDSTQTWTFDGQAGQTITLTAVDQSRPYPNALGLDMALTLLAPDGSKTAFNDDQPGTDLFGVYDSEIDGVTLPQTGTYTVRVDWHQGQGTYTLGVQADQPIILDAGGVTQVEGSLQDVFPLQRWDFAGHKGDILTITMSTESGTLDPLLTLLKPDGSLLEYNDDAADPALGTNSQLPEVRLPADGTYTIEAGRAQGVGTYKLIIVTPASHS